MHPKAEDEHDIPSLPLQSGGPHEDIPVDQRIFAPFIGSWALDVAWYRKREKYRREVGEWHFSWVLEGRAIQDVWIVPARHLRNGSTELYEYGSSLRFYDAGNRHWQSIWIGPMRSLVRKFTAKREGDALVLQSVDPEAPRLRWVFTDIAADNFCWSNYEEEDGRFAMVQDLRATRLR